MMKPYQGEILSSSQDRTNGSHDLYWLTRRAALGGLIVTLCLGIAKLLGGWFGHSMVLLSDSFHSFGDAFRRLRCSSPCGGLSNRLIVSIPTVILELRPLLHRM